MRYNQIRECDIVNGDGIGIALFVQGCHFKCKNCFNPETWDFNGGKEWTPEIEDRFIELAGKPYIKRISILGGEPLADENLEGILNLVNKIRLLLPDKTIWLYTGYKFIVDISRSKRENKIIFNTMPNVLSGTVLPNDEYYIQHEFNRKRLEIIKYIDILVDGQYIDSKRDISLKWRGSRNQRVIDIRQSFEQGKIILYCE